MLLQTDVDSCLHTRKNKNEKGADSSDDTDDLTHVGDKHGDDKSDGDPDHSENDSAATLKWMSDDPPTTSLNTQRQVQDDRSDRESDNLLKRTLTQHKTNQLWRRLPSQKKNNRIDSDNWYSKK